MTGGTVNSYTHSITFSQKDERILKLIAKYMEADYVLMPTGKTRTVPTLVINSREIKKDLAAMGITHNKSLTLPFPKVPEKYLSSFIRGVIDGDGYVAPNGYTMNVTTASMNFAQGLLKVFLKWGLNSYIREQQNPKGNIVYRVRVNGKDDLIRLSLLIYKYAKNDDFVFYKRVYLSQHSKNPFIIEDNRQKKAWEIAGTQIVHINNSSKHSIKIRINRDILSKIKILAKEKQIL